MICDYESKNRLKIFFSICRNAHMMHEKNTVSYALEWSYRPCVFTKKLLLLAIHTISEQEKPPVAIDLICR